MNNANARFLKEARELEKLWDKTGLLKNLPDKYQRNTTAALLCCQRLVNEVPKINTEPKPNNYWLKKGPLSENDCAESE